MTVTVNVQCVGGLSPYRAGDGDWFPDDHTSVTVFCCIIFRVTCLINAQKSVEEAGSQLIFAIILPLHKNGVSNSFQRFGKSVSRRIHIKTNTDNHILKSAVFQTEGAFSENAANLFAVDQNIIDPFYFGLLSCEGFDASQAATAAIVVIFTAWPGSRLAGCRSRLK